jgi:hypothetical protein
MPNNDYKKGIKTESSHYKVNTVTPMAIMDQITVLNSGSVKVRSNKDGVAYLVISSLSSSAPTQAVLSIELIRSVCADPAEALL